MADVEYSDSVYIQVTGVEVRYKFPALPRLQKSPISWNRCISLSVSTLLSGYVGQDIWVEISHSA